MLDPYSSAKLCYKGNDYLGCCSKKDDKDSSWTVLSCVNKPMGPLKERHKKSIFHRAPHGWTIKARILVSQFQMLNLLPFVFLIPFPELYLEVLRFFNQIFSFDLYNAMPMACIWPLGFMGSLVAKTAIPLVIILILLVYSKRCGNNDEEDGKIKPAEIAGAGWFMCVAGYPPPTWSIRVHL